MSNTVATVELYQAPRSWGEQAYLNLIYLNEVDEGNHFAAWHEPEIFTNELRPRSGHCVKGGRHD